MVHLKNWNMRATLYKTGNDYLLRDDKGETLAITSGTIQGRMLSKQNCDEIFGIEDVNELAEEWVFKTNGHKWSNNDDTAGDNYGSYKEGFNKAMELNKDKLFTVEDMKGFAGHVWKMVSNRIDMDSMEHLFEKYTQPKEIEVEIVMKKVVEETKLIGAVKGVKGSGDKITTYKLVSKLDSEGNLILKKI